MTPSQATRVEEVLRPGDVPLWVHPEWVERFPWLVQGTTGAGDPRDPFDLGLFGAQPVGAVMGRWSRLRDATGMRASVHARQIHGTEAFHHTASGVVGMIVMDGYDAHLTDLPGLLLSVSIADCVPVFLVDPAHRAVAAVHAGWRGVAGGGMERTLARMGEAFGTRPAEVWVHLGPSICGACYEVGPEVHRAVHPTRPAPAAPTPIDLRAALAERAAVAGVPAGQTSVSAHCTRCGPGAFFSHRAGSPARQMGVLGVRG
jgi:YfiH family protein